jgi:hypothetical protein
MAKHIVKCFYCGKSFDANAEPFTKPRANRYAHAACDTQAQSALTQEERDYQALVEYIKDLFGKPNPRVWKQLKEYKDLGYTYSGIHKTLIWWFELKHNDLEKANGGIGIVPYVYEQASQYYYALYLAQITNAEKDVEHLQASVKEFFIEPPKAERKHKRLFKFQEDEE